MSSRKSKQDILAHRNVTIVRSEGGTVSYKVDVSRLPKPERTMACNVVDVYCRGSSVEMAFGQQAPGGDRLLAALVVSVPVAAVPLVLHNADSEEKQTFQQRVETYIERVGSQVEESSIAAGGYPDRTVLERASTLSIAHVDHDAQVLFFRVNPTEFRRMQETGDWTSDFLSPVVEVSMSTELLAALVRKLAAATTGMEGA